MRTLRNVYDDLVDDLVGRLEDIAGMLESDDYDTEDVLKRVKELIKEID